MNTTRWLALIAAAVTAASLLPGESSAAPVFARKYGFNCTMCHSAYPRLNDFGARFRANGYRLPGRENAEKTVLETPTPLALRTNAGYAYQRLQHSPEPGQNQKHNAVELGGLDVLSGGTLGPQLGYFLVYVPGITESRGVAGQEATLEMASVVFSGLARGLVTVRAGRFEPAYTAFSAKRQLSASAYEAYEFSFPGGPGFSETQTGVEIRGGGYGPLRVMGGVVEGSATNRGEDPPQDGYLRLECVRGAGEGQTTGQRLGVTGYLGHARPLAAGGAATDRAQCFSRFGVDASLNAAVVNLAAQYLWARDAGPLWGRSRAATWSGGFVELSAMPATNAVGFGRLDLVLEPSILTDRTTTRFTGGARYYLEDNVALHLEFSHAATSVEDTPYDPTEDSIAARVDFAF